MGLMRTSVHNQSTNLLQCYSGMRINFGPNMVSATQSRACSVSKPADLILQGFSGLNIQDLVLCLRCRLRCQHLRGLSGLGLHPNIVT